MELFNDLISSLISPISGFSVKSTVNNGDEKFINLIGVVKKEGPSILSPPIWNSTMFDHEIIPTPPSLISGTCIFPCLSLEKRDCSLSLKRTP